MKYKYVRLLIVAAITASMLLTACGKPAKAPVAEEATVETENKDVSDKLSVLDEKADIPQKDEPEQDDSKEVSGMTTDKNTGSNTESSKDTSKDNNTTSANNKGQANKENTDKTDNNKPSSNNTNKENNDTKPENPKPTPTPKPDNPKPTPTPVHKHEWKEVYQEVKFDAVTEEIWVVDQEAYDEEKPVYERKEIARCECGVAISGDPAVHLKNHALNGDPYGSWRLEYERVQVGTEIIHHEEVGHYETKIISDAYTEKVMVGYSCTCGEVKYS